MTHPVTIYLIHAVTPHRHAGHYLGVTKRDSLLPRMKEHLKGDGSTLVRLFAMAAGIQTAEELIERLVVATWSGTRDIERKLKNWKGLAQICPVCRAAKGKQPYVPQHLREVRSGTTTSAV